MNAVLLRQATNHEQTEKTTWRLIEGRWVGDPLVELDEVLFANTEAFIEDLDLDAFNGLLSRNVHRC